MLLRILFLLVLFIVVGASMADAQTEGMDDGIIIPTDTSNSFIKLESNEFGTYKKMFRPDTMQYPVVPYELVATFGELRNNHFHGGIDVRVGGKVGTPLYAVADGYVSRIWISPYSYGRVVMVAHKNGYESFYAHTSAYSEKINSYAYKEQVRLESYAIDYRPDSGLIPVKKGEVIALAGNTGASMGPHLHFEMRIKGTDEEVNPFLLGYGVEDHIAPRISSIKVYPLQESNVNGSNSPSRFAVIPVRAGKYKLKLSDTIHISGLSYFGINAIDQLTPASNRDGVYDFELKVDDVQVFGATMNRIDFHNTRSLNSAIDYAETLHSGEKILITRVAANNQLEIYNNVVNHGVVLFNDGKLHKLEYLVRDFSENTSTLVFWVRCPKRSAPAKPHPALGKNVESFFMYQNENTYENDEISLKMDKGALFDSIYFEYDVSDKKPGLYSRVHSIHNPAVPINKDITLSIKPDKSSLLDKLCIAKITPQGGRTYIGGAWDGKYITTKIRFFGKYAVVADSTPPTIKILSLGATNKGKSNLIKIHISDNFSGIRTWKPYIDGKFIVMEYDPRTSLLVYYFDSNTGKGKHDFSIEVEDHCGNKRVIRTSYMR